MNSYLIYIVFSVFTLGFSCLLILPILTAKNLPQTSRNIFSLAIAILFLGGGIGLYSLFGTPEILPLIDKREEKLAELKTAITTSAAAIKANPKNLNAWVDLGDNFMETGQFSGAVNSFKQAVLLSGGNPIIIMAYARALIAEKDGKISDDAQKSLQMVLMLQPQNEEARYFMAVRKLQTGDTQAAMSEMKALYKTLPDNSPVKAMIDRQIGRSN